MSDLIPSPKTINGCFITIMILLIAICVICTPSLIYKKNSGFTLKDVSNKEWAYVAIRFKDKNAILIDPKSPKMEDGIFIQHYPADSVTIEFMGFDMKVEQFKVHFERNTTFEYHNNVLIKHATNH